MTVNIAGTFKKDVREFNGLEAIAKELTEEPLTRQVVVGLIETKKTTKDHTDGGSETVTVRFVHLEALADEAAADGRKLMDDAYRARTNRNESAPVDDGLFDGPQAKE